MHVSCVIQNKTHVEQQSIARIFCICDTHWTANKLVAKCIAVKLATERSGFEQNAQVFRFLEIHSMDFGNELFNNLGTFMSYLNTYIVE
jgi:hypothetical protein